MTDDAPDMQKELAKAVRLERVRGDWDDLTAEDLPDELKGPYILTEEAQAWIEARVQPKYQRRRKNIRRAWNRLQRFMPELMHHGDPKRVVELSTAHGSILEVLRHFGHDVVGTDYANMVYARGGDNDELSSMRALNDDSFTRTHDDTGLQIEGEAVPDWPYKPIIESIGIPVEIFDAGRTPYPFEDKSFDVLISMQAIEHYCHPSDWPALIDEYCRISRQSVFILLNRVQPPYAKREGYLDAFEEFRLLMRSYNKHGFRCVGTFMHFGFLSGFKLMKFD